MSATALPRAVDICIFGASGFTGKFVALRAAAYSKAGLCSYSLAGRSKARLDAVAQEIAKAGLPPPAAITIADVADASSLQTMAESARCILNCAGPFKLLGEPVIKAAVAAGTHCLDLSGEPLFLETVELKYDKPAQASGSVVIGSSAFDSVPADLGAAATADVLRRAGCLPTAVFAYLSLNSTSPAGVAAHYATYESAVHGFGSTAELARVRRQYRQEHPVAVALPTYGGRPVACADSRNAARFLFWSPEAQCWAMRFPGSDASVVKRTQRNIALGVGAAPTGPASAASTSAAAAATAAGVPSPQSAARTPFSFHAFLLLPSTYAMLVLVLYGFLFALLARFAWGRQLLLRHPRLFSRGFFSHEGPSPEQIRSTSFRYRMVAVGHEAGEAAAVLANPKQPRTTRAGAGSSGGATVAASGGGGGAVPPATMRAVLDVCGPEPGYDATSTMIAAAAVALLEHRASLPAGGVFTPGSVFAPGSPATARLVALLADGGVRFETVDAPRKVALSNGGVLSHGQAAKRD